MNETYSIVQNNRRKIFWTKKRKNQAFIASLLALPIIGFLVFWLYVNASSLALAFEHEYTGEFTLDNFGKFFENIKRDWGKGAGIKIAVENTFISAAVRMFFAIPLVIVVSYILFKKFYGHMFYRIVFYIPGMIGTVVSVTMQMYILDAIGPVVSVGSAIGVNWSFDILQKGLLGSMESARITYFITGMLTIGGGTILLLTGSLQKIPKDLFDQMKIDGAGMVREFINLALPCSWSTVGIVWVMSFADAWKDYSRVMLLTGGANNTNNMAYYMFHSSLVAINGETSYNYPAAMGVMLTLVIAPITIFLRWLANKIIEPVEF